MLEIGVFPEVYGDLRLDRMFFTPIASRIAPLILGDVGICGELMFTLSYVEEFSQLR